MLTDKRQLSLAALLMACLALYFWTQSRYPALDQKAQMGQRASISAIAFDTVVKVDVAQPYLERVWKSSLNWGYTNWKGMTFGLLFAAAFITFLRLLPSQTPSRFRAINALKGMFIGIPLGVCANCSTPIAYGMVKAGTRVETALATLFSSPTLNIYVLTTTFSLLPLHMALLKLFGVVFLVVILVPVLVRRFVSDVPVQSNALSELDALSDTSVLATPANAACALPARTWFEAITRVVPAFLLNLWFIVKTTLPLMLLAGVLGAVVIEGIPTEALADVKTSVVSLLSVSLIATFLPVPMMFDVVTTMILMASGLPQGLSMALLFALGVFSIYPAMVIARRISVALSLSLFFSIALLATSVGLIANYLDEKTITAATQTVTEALALQTPAGGPTQGISDERVTQLVSEICGQLADPQWQSQCQHRATQDIREGNLAVNLPAPQDTSACDVLTGPEAKQACHAKIGHDFAIAAGELAHCRVIPVAELQASCNESIMINRIKTQVALENVELSAAEPVSDVKKVQPAPMASVGNGATVIWTPIELSEIKSAAIKNAAIDSATTDDSAQTTSLTLERSGYLQLSLAANSTDIPFTKVTAESMGIRLPFDFRLSDFYEPFKYGRGIASGDIDNNGFADLVFATSRGPVIFVNRGNGQFVEQPISLPVTGPINTFVVAFVDINNDGWQDLFFTTYGGTNYWLENDKGTWRTEFLQSIANPNTSLTMAVAFADVNQNGSLDALLGNWTAGAENQFATQYSQNMWWVNQGNGFTVYEDDDVKGETLSVLLSDFNHNGRVDLVVGNDGDVPDLYYVDKPEGGFDRITPQQGIIPTTSLTTMSVDTADFNNDLRLDIFTTDMSFGPAEAPSYCELIDDSAAARQCHELLKGWQALKELKPQWCEQQAADQQKACVTAFATAIARNTRNPQMCDRITTAFADVQVLCRRMAETMQHTPLSLTEHISQQHNNKLLLADANGKFQDATKTMQVDKSFWSWNSKAADLDNDGWQDILVANGFGFGEQQNEIHSNVFFHNDQGKAFTRATDAFGLKEMLNTPSYTYVDFDGDGDLDVFATAIMASPRVYINQTKNRSISFYLRDEKANRFCIGCKVTIYYGNQQQQLRELKLSGGYLSFDEPVAMFGVAQNAQVDRVVVQWSDGQITEIRQPLAANNRYKITRTAAAEQVQTRR